MWIKTDLLFSEIERNLPKEHEETTDYVHTCALGIKMHDIRMTSYTNNNA